MADFNPMKYIEFLEEKHSEKLTHKMHLVEACNEVDRLNEELTRLRSDLERVKKDRADYIVNIRELNREIAKYGLRS
jgi:chromosome segregation ATPase